MSKHGALNIRKWKDSHGREGITFWCAACESAHSISTSPGGWQFNGNFDEPVIHPSVRTYYPAKVDKETGAVIEPEKTLCHSFVGCQGAQPGEIIYLDDSQEHNVRGVHKLVPWPEWFGAAGE